MDGKFSHLSNETLIAEIELEQRDIANGTPDFGFVAGMQQELKSRENTSNDQQQSA